MSNVNYDSIIRLLNKTVYENGRGEIMGKTTNELLRQMLDATKQEGEDWTATTNAIGSDLANTKGEVANNKGNIQANSEAIRALQNLTSEGYVFEAVVRTTDSPREAVPTNKPFYIANEKGTYKNFKNNGVADVVMEEEGLGIIKWDGAKWDIEQIVRLSQYALIADNEGYVLNNFQRNQPGGGHNSYTVMTPLIRISENEKYELIGLKEDFCHGSYYDKNRKKIGEDHWYTNNPILSSIPNSYYMSVGFRKKDESDITPEYVNSLGLTLKKIVDNSSYVKESILSESFIYNSIIRDTEGNVESANVTFTDGKDGNIFITRDENGNAIELSGDYGGKEFSLIITRDSEGDVTKTSLTFNK